MCKNRGISGKDREEFMIGKLEEHDMFFSKHQMDTTIVYRIVHTQCLDPDYHVLNAVDVQCNNESQSMYDCETSAKNQGPVKEEQARTASDLLSHRLHLLLILSINNALTSSTPFPTRSTTTTSTVLQLPSRPLPLHFQLHPITIST